MYGRLMIVACGLCLVGSIASAGPFGLQMGQPVDDLDVEEAINSHIYRLASVPEPHPTLATYSAIVHKETGLCKVRAVSEEIYTSSFGHQMRTEFTRIVDQIRKTYGDPKVFDFINHGSLWDDPRYFMRSLRSKDRRLVAIWDQEYDYTINEDVSGIMVEAKSLDDAVGVLNIEFEFSNISECAAKIEVEEASAF